MVLMLFEFYSNTFCTVSKIDFRRITSNSGLSSEEIRNIFQDSEGYVWFLTPEGLNRYDGYDFDVYRKSSENFSFPTSAFECACEDSFGRIWLGTAEQGIVVFDKRSNSVLRFDEISGSVRLPEKSIRSLLYDSDNKVWIGTENGLYVYSVSEDRLTYHNLANPGASSPEWCIVEDIMEDNEGNKWIATWNEGLFIWDEGGKEFMNYKIFDAVKEDDQNNQIKSLFQDRHGFVWVGTWEDGLYKTVYQNRELLINGTFVFRESDPQSVLGNIIYSVNQDLNGHIWIGTPYGLSVLENPYAPRKTFHHFRYQYGSGEGLSNNEVWKIFRDRSGIMWLGTLEGGINMAHPDGKLFESYTIPPVDPQIQSQTTQSFILDPTGQLLIGVKSLGFGYYNLVNREYRHYTEVPLFRSIPGNINTVNCFLNEGNRLWLGTRYNGVGVFDYQSREYTALPGLQASYDIRVLYLSKQGYVWVGSIDGLYRISKDDISDVRVVPEFNDLRVTSICEAPDGNIWVGSAENGICRLQSRESGEIIPHFYSMEENTVSDEITSLFYDGGHTIWIGTNDKGLFSYDIEKDKFERSNALQGPGDVSIMGICDDSEGNLWVTTNKGIARITHERGTYKADHFTITDGLQGNRFVANSIYKLSDDQILMGGYYGFNSFYPQTIRENSYCPPTVITSILINNEEFDYIKDERRIFRHNESSITFGFSSLSYYKAEKNIFSYRLEGLDQEWTITNADKRDVRYTKLPPSEYIFMVRSANSSEKWNEEAATFQFRVKPAPYKTWWAYLSYLFAFLLIVALIFRYQLRKQKIIRNLEIEKIQHEKTEKLNEYKLSFFTNISHEILTPLSIIMGAVGILKKKTRKGKDEIDIMERNLLGLNQLLRQLLDFRKMESGHLELKVREGDLVTVIQSIIHSFNPLVQNKNIDLEFECSEEVTGYFDEDKLNKILRNLLSNAIKYTPEKGQILIGVMKEENMAVISVKDNGYGISEKEIKGIFERFYRSGSTNRESGTGIGLALVDNLVRLHKGTIHVESQVGEGTDFTIRLPLGRSSYVDQEFEEDKLDRLKDDLETQDITPLNNATILLVEDNADFRTILKHHLESYARIIESSSGDDALRKAIKYSPSIVVSDVMMPNMNGFELCVQLKSNVDTQHIPVILLTAKTADIDRAKGYDCGADSFITKPVSLSVLKTRIQSLMLKQRSKASLPDDFKPVRAPNEAMSNEIFLEKLEEFVEENLSNVEFKVPDMHEPFRMSSSAFFRRVKQMTKQSPVEYVKNVRLNRAAHLLAKNELTISEIAYNTGFNDQSYFGSCFKKKFGMTPSDYMKEKAS